MPGQTIESSVIDSGTHVAHRPSMTPRVFSGNHSVMMVGAATPVRPMPRPSMKRPTYSMVTFSPASSGMTPPMITPSVAMKTVHFKPIRRQMNAAGNASTMPMSETHVMSMPNPAPVIMKLSAGLTGVAMK